MNEPRDGDEGLDELAQIAAAQRASRDRVGAPSVAERRRALLALHDAVHAAREEMVRAIHADLGKPREEVFLSEIAPLLAELRHARRHVGRWVRPQRVRNPLTFLGARARIVKEPKGCALVLAPWNFPLLLTLGPAASAIAAGCTVAIKPSERTPRTSEAIARVVAEAFAPERVSVHLGDAREAEALLREPFDHVFFTGGPAIGRIVMRAAAEHLASVTLELGGKSPALIAPGADLDDAAGRIAFGKWTNAGQACIAPDYVLVERGREVELADALARVVRSSFGDDPLASDAYGGLVDGRHLAGQLELLADAEGRGARRVFGGRSNDDPPRMEPTVLVDVPAGARILEEEIFGPLLPILPYDSLDGALGEVRSRPQPLTLYLFGADGATRERVERRTRAGTSMYDDTLAIFAHPGLPFGGVGESGLGKAHGRAGFDVFTNERSVLGRGWLPTPRLVGPPYTPRKRRLIEILARWS